MDIFTHALASIAVIRVAIPRAPRTAGIAILIAGTIADLDNLSALVSPSAYLTWHHTYTHSLASAAFIPVLLAILCNAMQTDPSARAPATKRPKPWLKLSFALFSAACLHLAFDACQSEGVAALWPFSARRIAADYLAPIDPWIIVILIAAILFPELLHLVSDEIGSKDKRPRGQIGAFVGLALVLLYIGARATFHSNVVAAMEARTYRGESPRRAAAFPESVSLFTWHSIVETDSAIHEFTLDAAPGSPLDPKNTVVLFKPESSPALEHARDSAAAKKFLSIARFPKATLEKTPEGFDVQLRDLRHAVSGDTHREISALVKTDSNGKLLDDSLMWTDQLQQHQRKSKQR
jgi:membrane-bound metal-dependent hydrolase YbcI (DUF457 family)